MVAPSQANGRLARLRLFLWGFSLVMAVAATVTYLLPRRYMAKAEMEVDTAANRSERLEELQRSREQCLTELGDEVAKQRKAAEESALEAARIRERDGIVDVGPEDQNVPIEGHHDPEFIESEIKEQKLQLDQLRAMMARTDSLKLDEFQSMMHVFNVPNPTFLQDFAELQRSQVEEANLLQAGLGAHNPRIKALRAERESIRTVVNGELVSLRAQIKTAQAAELKAEEEQLALMETSLARIRSSRFTGPYVEAKTKYLTAKLMLKAAEMRLSTARTKGIDVEPVRISEQAVPPAEPVGPRVAEYLMIAAVLGMTTALGLALRRPARRSI